MSQDSAKTVVLHALTEKREALRRFLVARFRDEDGAEDILQDVYLKLERTEFKAPIENVGAFLYRTVHNMALDRRKKTVRQQSRDHDWFETQSLTSSNKPEECEAALDAKEKLEHVKMLVDELPPQCRRVFIAHKFEGLSYREVAEQVGISKKTVEKHMSKALKHLIYHFKDMD
ncbi:sigma-70 family RNA polymerase sigma factor [Kordiimonas sp. SCSIO 12610]|uniref:sigma-70 family RNA polymerase sigma factor n=1 Tax=Kordiimonas sp. SCSIO 12610 TaxID=2829597 RepID=UPI0021088198|nr:sigma-70 family RNA polymerase sigma factor [Kordiimonas sp. SCSIO 12610]UTW54607.1 sigma-70 family RNA polymerase sigma factor [Kordiimonas sp. SCSIO 12610]